MSNGKFFSGLTEGMMRKHDPKPDRQKSNFFWPEEKNLESVSESRNRSRRASVQSPERETYSHHSETIPSPGDLHAKQQSSKIEFYDSVDAGTPQRLNNQNSMSADNGSIYKQKSTKSNVEFYDYSDEGRNNVSPGVKSKNSNKDSDSKYHNFDVAEVESKLKKLQFTSEMDNNRYNSSRSDHFDRPTRHEPVKNNFNQKTHMRKEDTNDGYYQNMKAHNITSSSVNERQTSFHNDVQDNSTTKYHQINLESSDITNNHNNDKHFEGRRQNESTYISTKQNSGQTNKTESTMHRPFTADGLESEKQNNETERTHYSRTTESNNSTGTSAHTHTQSTISSRHPSYQSNNGGFHGVVGMPDAVPGARVRAHNNLKSSIFFG